MDIQSTGDKLLNLTLQNLQKVQNEQLSLIARLTGINTNQVTKGLVTDSVDITPEQREKLLAQVDTALAQIKAAVQTPAVQQQIESLEQQKNLLQANLLKLITLEVNGKTFLTYSNQPLLKGQEINLRLIPNLGLQLLINPDDTPEIIKIEQAITQNLRQLLPLISHLPSQKQDNFFSNLGTLMQSLNKIPEKQLDQIIDKPLLNSLKKLEELMPTLSKAIDPKILKIIIENSGIQFEKRLVDGLKNLQPPIQSANQEHTFSANRLSEIKTSLSIATASSPIEKFVSGQSFSPHNLAPLLSQQAVGNANQNLAATALTSLKGDSMDSNKIPTPDKINPAIKIAANNTQIIGQSIKNSNNPINTNPMDLKGALIELVQKTGASSAEEDSDIAAAIKNPGNLSIKEWINQLIPILTGKMPQKDLSTKILRTQLIALLQQHAYQTVAKIQIQQLQSIQPQAAQQTDYPQQSWQLDIPIRYQQDIHPLQMHIERYWIEDKQKSSQHKREMVKQWRVMLNFDLPIVGQFYAQLIWFNQQLSATLWAEQADTLKIAKEKMENLRTKLQQEGIIVTQLDCLPGAPNKPQNEIQYSLIDIKT
jgi:Flagellar hook-length control protein FliK